MAKSPIVLPLSTTFLQRFSQHFSTDGGRNPIGWRTESDRTANGNRLDGGRKPIGRRTETDRTADGNRSDGERNLIGRRTESDWTADANGGTLRGCTCLKCTNRARNAPTEQELHQPSKKCTNRARAAPTEQELHPLQAPSVVTFSHRTHRTHRIYCCVFSHRFHGNTQIVRVQKIKTTD